MIHHHNSDTYLLVEVPENAHTFKIVYKGDIRCCVLKYYKTGKQLIGGSLTMHKGCDYELIGKASDLTEDQAAEIVASDVNRPYKDYSTTNFCKTFSGFRTATKSLSTLLQANNLKEDTTVILKRK